MEKHKNCYVAGLVLETPEGGGWGQIRDFRNPECVCPNFFVANFSGVAYVERASAGASSVPEKGLAGIGKSGER